MSNGDNQPKVVDTVFGDDAGFLSGLGIAAEAEKKAAENKGAAIPEAKRLENTTQQSKVVQKKNPETPHKPQLRQARIIKKADPVQSKPKPKKASGVDDLIDKKRKEATYDSSFRTGGGRVRGGRKPNFVQGKSRSRKPITIGHTKSNGARNAKKTTPTVKKPKVYKVSDSLKKKGTITMNETIVVKEFSEKMGVPLPEVMKVLLSNKILVAAQANIDFDTATLVASEFDVTVEKENTTATVEDILEGNLQAILNQDKEANDLVSRPPIVTIMGHVDHGKTKLLDYLRKTDVVGGEAGGITQSIGASQIHHNEQKITFIDTPGHELFTSLRARGSKITNIVVVVIAADDGVKPQTVEAIKHAQDAGVPIIVAITKIDLGASKLEEIKGQVAQYGLQPEDRGGDTMIIPLSSMTGQGVDDLLDAVLLQYEMLELKYSPSRNAVGVVVESHKSAKTGVTTSMILMTGTLKVGDVIVIHNTYGRVRKMTDWLGNSLKTASGGDPVMILGVQDLPEPGRVAEVVKSDKEANKRISVIKDHEQMNSKEAVLQSLADRIGKGDTIDLKIILKADSYGSLETIKHAANQVELPEDIVLKVVHSDVGSITSGDVTFAQAAGAILVGFNVGASGSLKKKADQLGVTVKEYDIIYQFLEYLAQVGTGMVEEKEVNVLVGRLEVLAVFFKRGKEMIFGGKITEGKAMNGVKIKVFREEDQIDDPETEDEDIIKEPLKLGDEGDSDWRTPSLIGTVTSLQKEQESVKELAEGHECGLKVRTSKKVVIGDIVEFWQTQIQ